MILDELVLRSQRFLPRRADGSGAPGYCKAGAVPGSTLAAVQVCGRGMAGQRTQARVCSSNWPMVIRLQKGFRLAKFGVADRLKPSTETFMNVDFRDRQYDLRLNGTLPTGNSSGEYCYFSQFASLEAGGTLSSMTSFSSDRTGHPFAMMFASQMLL